MRFTVKFVEIVHPGEDPNCAAGEDMAKLEVVETQDVLYLCESELQALFSVRDISTMILHVLNEPIENAVRLLAANRKLYKCHY